MINFVVSGLKALTFKLVTLQGFDPTDFHLKAAKYVKGRILSRTLQGKDADLKKFTPYSKGWAQVRKKAGHPVDKVDLNFSGTMLSSINYTADSEKALLFFLDTLDPKGMDSPSKAYFNQTGRVKRKFFAMSDKDIKTLVSRLDKLIQKALK